jgi:L-alanine-DL-glutamate epimerase-like enolase superfamily enzyme
MNRLEFLKVCGATAGASLAGLLPGSRLLGRTLAAAEHAETVTLQSWELVELPGLPPKLRSLMKITGSNGAVGFSKPVAKALSVAAEAAKGINLLDHDKLYDAMIAKSAPKAEVATLDIACWDLHARLLGKPLHAMLGTKRQKVLRYGDVRGQQPDFSPKKYAESVVRYFERTGFDATKLHFPGNMQTPQSIPLAMILETLQAVRAAVGKEKILAWDPYPGSAESATTSVDEAKQILKLMDELGYAWIEGPLPPTPYETQIPKYVELVKMGTKQRIQAEGPGSGVRS